MKIPKSGWRLLFTLLLFKVVIAFLCLLLTYRQYADYEDTSVPRKPSLPPTQHRQSLVHKIDVIGSGRGGRQHEKVLRNQMEAIGNELIAHPFPLPQRPGSAKTPSITEFIPVSGGIPVQSIVVSKVRSGSTFLADVINSHPASFEFFEPLAYIDLKLHQVRAGNKKEKQALDVITDLLHCNYDSVAKGNVKGFNQVQQLFGFHNWRLWTVCKRNGVKLCNDVQFNSQSCRLYPFQNMKTVRLSLDLAEELLSNEENIRMIYLIRDPRGTMNSRKSEKWCMSDEQCKDPNVLCTDLVDDYHAAQRLLQLYPARFTVLRYEDFSLAPFKGSENVFRFLGLNYHPDVKEFLENHTKVNKGNEWSTFRKSSDVVFRWRETLKFDQVQKIQGVCREAMQLWGYELAHNASHLLKFQPMKPT